MHMRFLCNVPLFLVLSGRHWFGGILNSPGALPCSGPFKKGIAKMRNWSWMVMVALTAGGMSIACGGDDDKPGKPGTGGTGGEGTGGTGVGGNGTGGNGVGGNGVGGNGTGGTGVGGNGTGGMGTGGMGTGGSAGDGGEGGMGEGGMAGDPGTGGTGGGTGGTGGDATGGTGGSGTGGTGGTGDPTVEELCAAECSSKAEAGCEDFNEASCAAYCEVLGSYPDCYDEFRAYEECEAGVDPETRTCPGSVDPADTCGTEFNDYLYCTFL